MINKIINISIKYLALIMMTSILMLVFFFQKEVKFVCKQNFILDNFSYLFIGIILFSLFYFLSIFISNKTKKYRLLILISLILLFLFLVFFSFSVYFISGWDVGVLRNKVYALIYHSNDDSYFTYFSMYPNNLLLLYIFKIIILISKSLFNIDHYFILVILQCFLMTVTLYLIYKITLKLLNQRVYAIMAYIVSGLFIAINPWLVIPYSDSIGIIFPVLILYIYLKLKEGKHIKMLMVSFAFLSAVAFKIKPQLLIVVIAIAIIEISKIVEDHQKIKLLISKALVLVLLFTTTIGIINKGIVPSVGVKRDEKLEFGYTHFLMMGLNEKTNGVFSRDDVNYSVSFNDVNMRKKANLAEAKQRIKDFGFVGLIKHFARKTLVNYGDGSFAWNKEGDFILNIPTNNQTVISDFLRSFIYPDGNNYQIFLSFKQVVWVTILVLVFIGVLSLNNNDYLNIVILSIVGLTIFQTLFEARARYLYCYSPFYVILAIYGIYNLITRIKLLCIK